MNRKAVLCIVLPIVLGLVIAIPFCIMKDRIEKTKLLPLIAMKMEDKYIEDLLKSGLDPNKIYERSPDEYTSLLCVAAISGDCDKIRLLVKYGAKVDLAPDKKYKLTPLMLAAVNGNDQAVELLLKHGANPNLVSDLGATPLMYAASRNHPTSVKLLIDAHTDVNIEDPKGRTALDSARKHQYNDVEKMLVEAGAK